VPATHVKKEPISPTKKATKRTYDDVVDLSALVESEDEDEDDNGAPVPSGSQTHGSASTEQRSSRSEPSKRIRPEPPGDIDVPQVLQDQFRVIAHAFTTISMAFDRLPMEGSG
jgi:hypothetical protein